MKLLRFWRFCTRRKTSKIGGSAYYTQKLQNRRFCAHRKNRRFCVVLKILLILFNTPKSEVLRTIRKNSKIGGFAPTAKTPKSEVLRSFKNIINNISYSKIGGSAYYTQKTPKSEVLRPPQKLQNRRFCVVLKISVIILNTPKSEVLRTIRKNSKIGGFA